jgi:hypothetical protein
LHIRKKISIFFVGVDVGDAGHFIGVTTLWPLGTSEKYTAETFKKPAVTPRATQKKASSFY